MTISRRSLLTVVPAGLTLSAIALRSNAARADDSPRAERFIGKPDAKVTVGIKNRGGVVTRSDALGTYRVPGFGKDVDTKDVDVNCEKEGYKQVKTNRRSAPTDAPIVETECTLQRAS